MGVEHNIMIDGMEKLFGHDFTEVSVCGVFAGEGGEREQDKLMTLGRGIGL